MHFLESEIDLIEIDSISHLWLKESALSKTSCFGLKGTKKPISNRSIFGLTFRDRFTSVEFLKIIVQTLLPRERIRAEFLPANPTAPCPKSQYPRPFLPVSLL